ncbi:MAG: hypothetical protein AB1451_12750 [Nitrospirota bacterium]
MLLAGCGSPIELPAPPAPPSPAPPAAPPPPPVQIVAAPVLVAMPSNLSVTASDGAADLLWDLVNGAQSYRLDWFSDPELLAGAASGTVSHDTLTNGLRYVYTVATGVQESVLSAAPVAADSTAPSQVSISAGLRDTTVSWSAVAGATAYRMYWSYEPNVSPSTGARIDVDGSQTAYTHSGLDPETHYYYVVTAILSDGTQGVVSAEVGARPGQTAAITATASDGRVDLTMPSNVSGSVEVSTSRTFDVPFLPFPLQDGEPVPIHVGDLRNGTRYAFRVRPVFTGGAGPASTTVYATPKASASDIPQTVTLTAGRGVNTLSWTPVTNASSYDVTWSVVYEDGQSDFGSVTVDQPLFRHSELRMCSTFGPACQPYVYLVRASSSSEIAPVTEALPVDLRPVPPLVTNTPYVILAGVKPSGSRVEIKDAAGLVIETVPFDRETGWTATVPLASNGTFVFRLVAIDETGLASTETVYQVTRDMDPPNAPAFQIVSCDPITTSPREVTLSGDKDSGSAVFRHLEPNDPDQQIVGATVGTTWSGVIEVEGQTFELIAKDAAGNSSDPVLVDLADPLPAGCS